MNSIKTKENDGSEQSEYVKAFIQFCVQNNLNSGDTLLGMLYKAYTEKLFEDNEVNIIENGDIAVIRHKCSCCGTPFLVPILIEDIPVFAERGDLGYTKTYKRLKDEVRGYMKGDFMWFIKDLLIKLEHRLCIDCLNRSTPIKALDIVYHYLPAHLDAVFVRPRLSFEDGSGRWGKRSKEIDKKSKWCNVGYFSDTAGNANMTCATIHSKIQDIDIKSDFGSNPVLSAKFPVYKCLFADGQYVEVLGRDIIPFIPAQLCKVYIHDCKDESAFKVYQRVLYKGTRRDGLDWYNTYDIICTAKYNGGDKEAVETRLLNCYMPKYYSNKVDQMKIFEYCKFNIELTNVYGKLHPFAIEENSRYYWSYGRPFLIPKPGDAIRIQNLIYPINPMLKNYWNGGQNISPTVFYENGKEPNFFDPFVVKDVYTYGYLNSTSTGQFNAVSSGAKPIVNSALDIQVLDGVGSRSSRVALPYCTFRYTTVDGKISNGIALLDAIAEIKTPQDICRIEYNEETDEYIINHGGSDMIFPTRDAAEEMKKQLRFEPASIIKDNLIMSR